MAPKRTTGFTVVELLIVVFVIAVLAAITIVSYRSIAARSTNTKIISNVKSYVNMLQLYSVFNKTYPTIPGETYSSVNMVCLGVGYVGGKCGKVSGVNVYESSTFTDKLGEVASNRAPVNFDPGTVASEQFVGAVYGIDIVGPPAPHSGYARVVEWFLIGENQNCGVPNSYGYASGNGNTACELFLEAV